MVTNKQNVNTTGKEGEQQMKNEEITAWIPVEKVLPEEDGEVLITLEVKLSGEIHTYFDFAYFSKDLYEVDDHEFQDKKGISGFYSYGRNGGVCEVKPTSWHPLPEGR